MTLRNSSPSSLLSSFALRPAGGASYMVTRGTMGNLQGGMPKRKATTPESAASVARPGVRPRNTGGSLKQRTLGSTASGSSWFATRNSPKTTRLSFTWLPPLSAGEKRALFRDKL